MDNREDGGYPERIINLSPEVMKVISKWRSFLLNVTEARIKDKEDFSFLRKKILKTFGESGIQGDLSKQLEQVNSTAPVETPKSAEKTEKKWFS